jgi:nitroimidazol reductase NimA-like FMN-containing flavoprotein (pyridoxamine 5'-phosphate oxidase superfamily)
MSSKRYPRNPVEFSNNELEFLQRNEICRIATSSNNIPHIVPVAYIFDEGMFYFATDYETVKFKNLKKNRNIAIVVDVYDSPNNKAVLVQGIAKFIEQGEEFKRIYALFLKKFDWVKKEPWFEGESPFVAIKPEHKISWGL